MENAAGKRALMPNSTHRITAFSRCNTNVGNLNGYLDRASVLLFTAPSCIGFEESLQAQACVQQLTVEKLRLSEEVKWQSDQLQETTNEKATLANELRALQDNHALLRANLQVLQDAATRSREEGIVASSTDVLHVDRPPEPNFVLTSRQRALLESLSSTAQESAALGRHGFFVDIINLSDTESALAAGPPNMESFESWELAVRKVYEQHFRQLQGQVQSADRKAMEMYLIVQQTTHLLRMQEMTTQGLREEVASKQQQLSDTLEDMATTRKNYDNQLGMLTEHLCTLATRLSDKDASLASLQSYKILCGHCGMWNTMGKLLSSHTEGMCQTCKDRVLSRS